MQTTSAPMAWLFLQENVQVQYLQKIALRAENPYGPRQYGFAVFSALAIFCCHWGSTFSGRWHGYWCLCRCHFHLLLYPIFVCQMAMDTSVFNGQVILWQDTYIDGVIISRHVPSFSTRCIKPLVVNCFNCLFIAATLMPTSSDSFWMVMSGIADIRLRILLVELLRKITRSPSNHHTLSPLSVRKRMFLYLIHSNS